MSRHGLGRGSWGPPGPAYSWGDHASRGGPPSLAGKVLPRAAASPGEVSHCPSEQFTAALGKATDLWALPKPCCPAPRLWWHIPASLQRGGGQTPPYPWHSAKGTWPGGPRTERRSSGHTEGSLARTHPPLRAPYSCTDPPLPCPGLPQGPEGRFSMQGRGLLTPHQALACPSQSWSRTRRSKVSEE